MFLFQNLNYAQFGVILIAILSAILDIWRHDLSLNVMKYICSFLEVSIQ